MPLILGSNANLSFLRKSRAPWDYFNGFWTPAFAEVTDFGLFTRPSLLVMVKSKFNNAKIQSDYLSFEIWLCSCFI
jgi:hypothetical protein